MLFQIQISVHTSSLLASHFAHCHRWHQSPALFLRSYLVRLPNNSPLWGAICLLTSLSLSCLLLLLSREKLYVLLELLCRLSRFLPPQHHSASLSSLSLSLSLFSTAAFTATRKALADDMAAGGGRRRRVEQYHLPVYFCDIWLPSALLAPLPFSPPFPLTASFVSSSSSSSLSPPPLSGEVSSD